jgi:hypothetical protein
MTTSEQIVKKYLTKNYNVKDKRFFNTLDNEEEWGFKIVELIKAVFSLSLDTAELYLLEWATDFGLHGKEFEQAIKPQKLKVNWSRETIQDLRIAYGVESAEETITRQIAEEISKEIDNEILKGLIEQVKTTDDLTDIAKCVGYETILEVDEHSFIQKYRFQSIKSTEAHEHRKQSKIWNST